VRATYIVLSYTFALGAVLLESVDEFGRSFLLVPPEARDGSVCVCVLLLSQVEGK
jgi:hypothetical protein